MTLCQCRNPNQLRVCVRAKNGLSFVRGDEIGIVFGFGMKVAWRYCMDLINIGFSVGMKLIWVFGVRIENELLFVWVATDMVFVWVVEFGLVFVSGPRKSLARSFWSWFKHITLYCIGHNCR